MLRIASLKRVQIAGCVVISILFPAMIRAIISGQEAYSFGLINTYIASLIAILTGYFLYHRMVGHPGVKSALYILPIFFATFAVMAFLFMITRLEYSRLIFISSAVLSIMWFYSLNHFTRSKRRFLFAVVPGGAAINVTDIGLADWLVLSDPTGSVRRVDGIVADLRSEPDAQWAEFITESALNAIPVYDVKSIRESLTGMVEIDHLSENVFGSLVPGMGYLKIKFIVEWIAAFFAVLLLAPLILVIAMIIKLEGSGPVFFRQQRIGFRGKEFPVFKFRTMAQNATQRSSFENAKTKDGDQRITGVGRWLRKHRLDEIPQLLNILRGEMSLIGPRPEAVQLSKVYESELPYYRYRHIVRPGISGWAQVNQGHVAEVAEVNFKLHYDFYYIKHCSLWLDIVIALRTVNTVLIGTGAK